MHQPFNESYLRTLRAAFPSDPIVFHAAAAHLQNLAPRVADLDNIVFKPCEPFTVPFGLSRHNPVGGRLAARTCRRTMASEIAGKSLRLVSLLGIDGNLYAAVGCRWRSVSTAPLHMILHGQLGDAMVWRSRNPLVRNMDLVAEIKKPLPPSVHVVALELGVREAIAEIAPRTAGSILTLEHPILVDEWSEPEDATHPKLKIAFLGNARRSKGFEVFANLARSSQHSDLEFQSIGVSAPDTDHLDVAMLARAPSRTSLSRRDYLDAVREIDLVCLPLHSRAYDFTASGTISDAITALKPVLAFRNRTLDAIVAKYGPIGWLVDSEAELIYLVQTLERKVFEQLRPEWVDNLKAMRVARRPELLAARYAELIAGGHGA
jgi:hypothetical protein